MSTVLSPCVLRTYCFVHKYYHLWPENTLKNLYILCRNCKCAIAFRPLWLVWNFLHTSVSPYCVYFVTYLGLHNMNLENRGVLRFWWFLMQFFKLNNFRYQYSSKYEVVLEEFSLFRPQVIVLYMADYAKFLQKFTF